MAKMEFGFTIEVVPAPDGFKDDGKAQPANQSGTKIKLTREQQREQRSKRLWNALQSEGKPEPEPGTTFIRTTKAGRLHQRNFQLNQIRKAIEALPEKRRPIISRHGGTLILDYGIYQEEHDLRGFRITLVGYTVPSLVEHAEQLSAKYRGSPSAYERDAAGQVGLHLAELRRNLDNAWSDLAIVAAFKLGMAVERLENVVPRQYRALTGMRQAKRNAEIAKGRELSEGQLRQRWQAVQDELTKQARRGHRLNRKLAYESAAKRLRLSAVSVKNAFLAIDRG